MFVKGKKSLKSCKYHPTIRVKLAKTYSIAREYVFFFCETSQREIVATPKNRQRHIYLGFPTSPTLDCLANSLFRTGNPGLVAHTQYSICYCVDHSDCDYSWTYIFIWSWGWWWHYRYMVIAMTVNVTI